MKYQFDEEGLKFIPDNEIDIFDLGSMMALHGGEIRYKMPEGGLDHYKLGFQVIVDVLKNPSR